MTCPPPLFLVVNPVAGGGRAARALPRVQEVLRAAGHDLRTELTRSLDHAEELAAAAASQDRVVVAFGGDGLAGRVAGAAARAQARFAVLPGGRGNDFVRALGLPRDPVAAAALLAGAQERRVDLAEAGGRAFLGIASLGFDSVVQDLAAATRLPLGQGVYLYAALRALRGWRPATFRVRADGVDSTLVGYSVAVANSGVYGGGMRLAPSARLDDGLLEVVTTAACGRGHFLATLPKVFAGTHLADPAVRLSQARVVEVEADRAFRVYADGDPVAVLPVAVVVRPGALRLLATPPTGPAAPPARAQVPPAP